MGIELACGEKSFNCSYSYWNTIRTDILKATFDYIDGLFKDETILEEDINEANDLLKLKKMVFGGDRCLMDPLIVLCRDIEFLNAFNKFNLGGVFALCNQSDCSGYYTPGNSLDICILLDTIKPYLKKYETYDSVCEEEEDVYSVFENSYLRKRNVIIC
jgi:hypothetical protein